MKIKNRSEGYHFHFEQILATVEFFFFFDATLYVRRCRISFLASEENPNYRNTKRLSINIKQLLVMQVINTTKINNSVNGDFFFLSLYIIYLHFI